MKTTLFFFIPILWLGCSQPTDNSIANTQNKEQQDTIKWAFPPYQEWDDALYMGIPKCVDSNITLKMVKGVYMDEKGIPDTLANNPDYGDGGIFCFVADTLICRYASFGEILIDGKEYVVGLLEIEYNLIGNLTDWGHGLEYLRYENNKVYTLPTYSHFNGKMEPEIILFDFSEKIGNKRHIQGLFFTGGDTIELQSIDYSSVYHDTIFHYNITANMNMGPHSNKITWMDVGKTAGITGFGVRLGMVTDYKYVKFNNYSKKENLNAVFQLTDKEPKWEAPYSE